MVSTTYHVKIKKKKKIKDVDFQIIVPTTLYIKFIYSDKATKFCEISTKYLASVLPVK